MENIKSLWIILGRQPRYSEIKAPLSNYSAGTYENRFGTWRNALREFVNWVNTDSVDGMQPPGKIDNKGEASIDALIKMRRRTRREISDRQRFRILIRDGFRCGSCGASPLSMPGTELHVDDVLPWSKAGETLDENLQVKCKQCNLGKGNAFDS